MAILAVLVPCAYHILAWDQEILETRAGAANDNQTVVIAQYLADIRRNLVQIRSGSNIPNGF